MTSPLPYSLSSRATVDPFIRQRQQSILAEVAAARQRQLRQREAETKYIPTPDGKLLEVNYSGGVRYTPSPEQLADMGDPVEATVKAHKVETANLRKLPVEQRMYERGTVDPEKGADSSPSVQALYQVAMGMLTGMSPQTQQPQMPQDQPQGLSINDADVEALQAEDAAAGMDSQPRYSGRSAAYLGGMQDVERELGGLTRKNDQLKQRVRDIRRQMVYIAQMPGANQRSLATLKLDLAEAEEDLQEGLATEQWLGKRFSTIEGDQLAYEKQMSSLQAKRDAAQTQFEAAYESYKATRDQMKAEATDEKPFNPQHPKLVSLEGKIQSAKATRDAIDQQLGEQGEQTETATADTMTATGEPQDISLEAMEAELRRRGLL